MDQHEKLALSRVTNVNQLPIIISPKDAIPLLSALPPEFLNQVQIQFIPKALPVPAAAAAVAAAPPSPADAAIAAGRRRDRSQSRDSSSNSASPSSRRIMVSRSPSRGLRAMSSRRGRSPHKRPPRPRSRTREEARHRSGFCSSTRDCTAQKNDPSKKEKKAKNHAKKEKKRKPQQVVASPVPDASPVPERELCGYTSLPKEARQSETPKTNIPNTNIPNTNIPQGKVEATPERTEGSPAQRRLSSTTDDSSADSNSESAKNGPAPIPLQHPETNWGPEPLPGTRIGWLGDKAQEWIMEKTGWKVTTSINNGEVTMSGRLERGGPPEDMLRSKKLAADIIRAQQESGIYPGLGVLFVLPHVTRQPQLKEPVGDEGQNTRPRSGANIEFITLGTDHEGIDWHNDAETLLDNVADFVQARSPGCWSEIPIDCMIDCQAVNLSRLSDKSYYKSCTGRHKDIFEAVWKDSRMADIAQRVVRKYAAYNQNRGTEEDFVVLLYCRNGLHRSIAAAKGLYRYLQYDNQDNKKRNIDVRVRNGMQEKIDDQFCTTCDQCLNNEERGPFEWNLVQKALKRGS